MERMLRRFTCDRCGMVETHTLTDSIIRRTIKGYELSTNGISYTADLCPECTKQLALDLSAAIIKFNLMEAKK